MRPLQASSWTAGGTRPPPPSSVVITTLPCCSASTQQQPGAVDVDVEEVVVGVPRLHPGEHRAALLGVVDDVHVRARHEPGAAPAGVHVDDDVRRREEEAGEEVGELLVRPPVRRARERAVEVDARRPHPRVRLRRGGREHRDDRDPPGDLLRLELLDQPQRRDLALVLVAVIPARTSTLGPSPFATVAIGMNVLAQPPVFRDPRQREPAELLARARRGRSCRRPASRHARQPAPRRPPPRSPRAGDRRPRPCAHTRSRSASGSAAARSPVRIARGGRRRTGRHRSGAGRRSSPPALRGSR